MPERRFAGPLQDVGVLCLTLVLARSLHGQQIALSDQASGVTAVLQAISPVNDSTVWVGGHGGVILRTVDGGRTWQRVASPGDDSLQFRDVYAASADTVFLLSAGSGALSRIYRTTDGGAVWRLQFLNDDAKAFYDCFDFWDPHHGIALSDAVDGRLVLLATADGGASWRRMPAGASPEAEAGEGGFAASGTCVAVAPPSTVWLGTGAAGQGRVYRSADRGRTWTATPVPFKRGSQSAGVATLAFRDALHGVALGGDIAAPDSTGDNVALTADGGRSWIPGGRPPFTGPVYGAAYAPSAPAAILVAAGPGGLAISRDDGRTWAPLSRENYWAVAFSGPGVGWAVGAHGRITRILLGRQ